MTLMNTRTAPRPALRLMAATVLLALTAATAQTAQAQPAGDHHGPRHGMRHGGPDMAMDSPRMVERMLDAVSASAEQRAQVKQLADAARADMKAQHESGRQLREQSAALFAQPTVDARAAEALRQQMLARHDQASKRQLQLMLDISRVLSPEQRKLLADRMVQRRAMMEKQRGEKGQQRPAAGTKPQT
jgi:Spy/CpxP family protein refolding chaperone